MQVSVSFEELGEFETGGSPVLSYNLQIDTQGAGAGPWINVQGYASDSLEMTGTVLPLTEGQLYYFRYRAKNVHGWGDYSPISWVLLANRPDTLDPVTTTSVGTNVEISWNLTPHERFSPVFAYRIKVKRFDGIFVEHSQCDGTDPTVISELKCTITMLSLFEPDFGLVEGDAIVATVEAMNAHDYSIPSPEAGQTYV